MRTLLIFLLVALALGGAGYYVHQNPALQTKLEPLIGSTASSTDSGITGSTTVDSSAPKGLLVLTFASDKLPVISDVTKDIAPGLCAVVEGASCVWNGTSIGSNLLQGGTKDTITISYPYSRAVIQNGTPVPITFKDPGIAGRYRVYLRHRNLIGDIDEVHEAHIVSVSGNDTKTFVWDGNENIRTSTEEVQTSKLKKGHYELVILNVDTGARGDLSSYIQTIDSDEDRDKTGGDLKAYAAHTPLVNSYWDGRGVFYDGKEGEDTIDLHYNRSDIDIFRGVDMPAQNQYLTLVFYRRGGDHAVIVTTNVEIIQFGDQTTTAQQLIQSLGE